MRKYEADFWCSLLARFFISLVSVWQLLLLLGKQVTELKGFYCLSALCLKNVSLTPPETLYIFKSIKFYTVKLVKLPAVKWLICHRMFLQEGFVCFFCFLCFKIILIFLISKSQKEHRVFIFLRLLMAVNSNGYHNVRWILFKKRIKLNLSMNLKTIDLKWLI